MDYAVRANSAALGLHGNRESLRQSLRLCRSACGEAPIVGVFCVPPGVLREHLGSVKLGIKGNAEELHICDRIRCVGKCLLNLAEVIYDERAKVRKRAACEDERDEERFAREGVPRDLAPFESTSLKSGKRSPSFSLAIFSADPRSSFFFGS